MAKSRNLKKKLTKLAAAVGGIGMIAGSAIGLPSVIGMEEPSNDILTAIRFEGQIARLEEQLEDEESAGQQAYLQGQYESYKNAYNQLLGQPGLKESKEEYQKLSARASLGTKIYFCSALLGIPGIWYWPTKKKKE